MSNTRKVKTRRHAAVRRSKETLHATLREQGVPRAERRAQARLVDRNTLEQVGEELLGQDQSA